MRRRWLLSIGEFLMNLGERCIDKATRREPLHGEVLIQRLKALQRKRHSYDSVNVVRFERGAR